MIRKMLDVTLSLLFVAASISLPGVVWAETSEVVFRSNVRDGAVQVVLQLRDRLEVGEFIPSQGLQVEEVIVVIRAGRVRYPDGFEENIPAGAIIHKESGEQGTQVQIVGSEPMEIIRTIFVREALNVPEISVDGAQQCPACAGSGENSSGETCKVCGGGGIIIQ